MGVLHTKSSYGEEKINLSFQKRSTTAQSAAMSRLKGMEQKLYAEFGCSDYKSFIEKIRDMFDPANVAVLQNFQPAQLSQLLSRFASGYGELYQEEVELVFDTTKATKELDFAALLGSKSGNFTVKSEGSKITVGVKYNHNTIKEVFNKLYKDRHFIESSENMQAIELQIKTLNSKIIDESGGSQNGFLSINLQNPDTGVFDQEFYLSPIPNFPWGVTKSVYNEAVKEKREDILNEFKRAGTLIKNFICEELCAGATPALKSAVKWAWFKNFDNAERDPTFFFQGTTTSNFISAVQGSLGEFQAAVIFTYLEQQLGSRSGYAQIIADKLQHGEQLRTDLSIIQGLGLQVKNMNTFLNSAGDVQLIRNLETTIHPQKLADYLDNGEQFLDYIANYYFNKTFAEATAGAYQQMIEMLGTYLGEVMNFAMGENMEDTVCFYFVGGQYLIPASRILEAAQELDLANSLLITSSYHSIPDLAYEMPFHINARGKRSPLYIEYWRHPFGNQRIWDSTAKNANIYNRLISHDISIRTEFNLMKEVGQYALF